MTAKATKQGREQRLAQSMLEEDKVVGKRFDILEAASASTRLVPMAAPPLHSAEPPAPKSAVNPELEIIRDSFTMPKKDHALVDKTKDRMLGRRLVVTKVEVLRAGLRALDALPDEKIMEILNGLEKIKAGRK